MRLREGGAADREAILALRRIAFPGEFLEKQHPDFWEWEFLRGEAGPGRIFVAEAGDRIVAHLGFLPQHYVAGDRTISVALAVDAMTDPEFRRQRVFSDLASFAAERLRREVQVAIGFQIRSSSLPGMLAGGWTVVDRIPVLLRPTWQWPLVGTGGDAIRTVSDFEHLDALVATEAVRQRRTAAFLHWRYLDNPRWRHTIEGWFEDDRPIAFLVHRETVLRGVPTLAIADAGGNAPALRRLIRHACARTRLLLAASCLSRAHPAWSALHRSGFVRGPHRFNLLLQVFDDGLHGLHRAPWALAWGDTDHL